MVKQTTKRDKHGIIKTGVIKNGFGLEVASKRPVWVENACVSENDDDDDDDDVQNQYTIMGQNKELIDEQ